jgi:hypothetical protein
VPRQIKLTDLSLGPRLRSLVANLETIAAVAAFAIGLTSVDLGPARPIDATESTSTDPPGSGVIVRSEVLSLLVPEVMVDLAQSRFDVALAPASKQGKATLEGITKEDLWYAMTVRTYQVNGRSVDITYIRHPYSCPESPSQEFRDVLSKLAGKPPRHPIVDYSPATVKLVPTATTPRGDSPGRSRPLE